MFYCGASPEMSAVPGVDTKSANQPQPDSGESNPGGRHRYGLLFLFLFLLGETETEAPSATTGFQGDFGHQT